jgi:tetratricopeptide (TPR) repeat protein
MESIMELISYGVSIKEIKPLLGDHDFLIQFTECFYEAQNCHFQAAISGFQQLQDQYPHSPLVMEQLARTYQRSGDFFSAGQVFGRIRRTKPYSIEQLDYFALLFRHKGSLGSAERLADEMYTMAPDRHETYVVSAIVKMMKNDYENALSEVSNAIKKEPRHALAHQVKGDILLAIGKTGEASLSYRNAYKICRDVMTYDGLFD